MTTGKTPRDNMTVESKFSADSLVGSFFHGNEWQGLVVAEPVKGIYLVQMLSWADGCPTNQQLIRIEQMLTQKWMFYSDNKEMVERYNRIGRRVFQDRE